MKYRVLHVCCAVLAVALTPSLFAIVLPRDKALPDYDIRQNAVSAAAAAKGSEQESLTALRARVPKLQLSRDAVSNTPRHVGNRTGFLTGPQGAGGAVSPEALNAISPGDAHRVVKAFVNEHAAAIGHDASLFQTARIERESVGAHNGLHTVVWQQTQNEIPVFGGRFVSHVTAQGELVSISDTFVASPAAAAAKGTPGYQNLLVSPRIDAQRAVTLASANTGGEVAVGSLNLVDPPVGAPRRQAFTSADLLGKSHAALVWMPVGPDSMRLTWQVIIGRRAPTERYLLLIDAETGEMLYRQNLAVHAKQSYNVFPSDSPSPFSPGWSDPSTNQPPTTNRTLIGINGAINTNASPLGWVYTSGRGLINVTRGNNVNAFSDRDWDWLPDQDRFPSGGRGPDLTFNFPLGLTNDPVTYNDASVVQLFWRANWFHDTMYGYGFTEQTGNFQVTNFNRGGLDGDPVNMCAQSGADMGISDNAVFYTAPDGYEGFCEMYVWSYPSPKRDGALDSEIVVHELTHGLTSRMLGGGVGISQPQTRGLGEGWSDFYAMALLSDKSDDHHAAYANGAYVTYNFGGLTQNYYYGVRRYPYSTDMSKNPQTFKDIDPTQASAHRGIPTSPIFGGTAADEVHNMGEIWCMALWEVRAQIIDEVGWEKGNQIMIQLVTDGLLLAPPNCTFIEARDAIITADRIATGGAFYDPIWKGFAKRGMGDLAIAPPSNTSRGVVESYELPADIAVGPPDGILEVKVNPPAGSVLIATDTNLLAVRVSDTIMVTNATVTASVGATSLNFANNGLTPDKYANDATYSANLIAPTNVDSITVPIIVRADGKQTVTNIVTYPVVPLPPNDNFANSFKVPSAGTSFFTSNRRATLEPGEPEHGLNAGASLWYNYTPTFTGDVLVDSTGSEVSTVVAVYTSSVLSNLTLVASAEGSVGRKGAFLYFKGTAGVVYRIAVASADARSTGAIRLRVGQGITADNLPPFTTVTSPQNGFSTTTNRLAVHGTAVDPDPTPSGINFISITISSGLGETTTTTVYPPSNFGGPPSTNWTATVGLRSGANKLQISSVDWAGNRSSVVTLNVNYRAIDPPNDLFATAGVLTNVSGIVAANTRNATKELGEPNHAGFAGGKSAWWVFTAPAEGILHLSTTNSTFDTVMAVYTGSRVDSLTPLSSNDDAYSYAPGGFSEISQPVRAGEVYHVAVDGYDNAGGAAFLEYSYSTGAIYKVNISSSSGGSVAPASMEVAGGSVITLTAIPDEGSGFSIWSGDIVSMQNPLTLTVTKDITVRAEFLATELLADDFETGDLTKLPWTTQGDAAWFVHAGNTNPAGGSYSAKAGQIAANQTSSLKLIGAFRTGDASFDLKASSEPVWDRLSFYIDGQLMQQWSGEVPWRSFAYPLVAGTHTLEWRYTKDNAGSAGEDTAYIDNIHLPIAPEINASTPPTLRLLEQTDGRFYIELSGQINQVYTLQRSPDLTTWTDIGSGTATSGILRFQDPDKNPAGEPRYYRAYVP